MSHLDKQSKELLSEIQAMGYESLRYSIFNDHRPSEWETRIEFDPKSEEYEVYSTMDRASITGVYRFSRFEDAKIRFFRNLDLTVFRYKQLVKEGRSTPYSSPLWNDSGSN
ncbi:hypothetical protein AT52_00197 [Streptococcus equi subsp. zooepidemicus Sz35]|uniref:Imm59 family immunity protein n=2 Tax=Streptococcus equi TaxID=1336 RepID=UPI0005B6F9C7|nr:Imm59 family immunity protein [Streptococcus equi]KIQ75808.1 hypothetical protein QQ41_05575 [Streptococcus equi subsp. zooepidemicus]KIS21051.1 hypothetical protein AT52_00197 [Streptococcus equi subsp. zooepidemicus Sz35]MCD3373399.1 hypothetical protein [Streptococcus equi subsp. zooepidemicus]MCD3375499.1 hypothetical protein [Streptococcus equi subsp. zooepidemicus]MCD3404113.1 hypothetical protein [Streptococcus equi subsp. zooepidemicus]